MLWAVRAFSDFEANLTSVERIKEYTKLPREVTRVSNLMIACFLKNVNYLKAEWEVEHSKPDKSWPAEGKIEFKQYSVRYRDDLDFTLKNLSFTINPGEKVTENVSGNGMIMIINIFSKDRNSWKNGRWKEQPHSRHFPFT